MGAVFACQELDPVVEGLHCGRVRLALLNDVHRVPGSPAEQAVLTGRLQAAVRVQAIHQAIWKGRGGDGSVHLMAQTRSEMLMPLSRGHGPCPKA